MSEDTRQRQEMVARIAEILGNVKIDYNDIAQEVFSMTDAEFRRLVEALRRTDRDPDEIARNSSERDAPSTEEPTS